jgi:pilus assembly protein CpaB
MKRIFPLFLAVLVFLIAFILLRPAPSRVVVVAAYDLRAGRVLQESDLALKSLPAANLPPDVITAKELLIGQPLRIDRGQGDVIRASHVGNMLILQPGERAVAVRVTDSTGIAGVLAPGQLVGLVASIPYSNGDVQGAYSKVSIEGLRVLYVDPRFSAMQDVNVVPQATPQGVLAGVTTEDRAREGSVVLAVPTNLQSMMYDFSAQGAPPQTRFVNVLELLSALDATDGAHVSLYLMPQEGAQAFTSPGLWLPELIVPPYTPTPSPTPSAP